MRFHFLLDVWILIGLAICAIWAAYQYKIRSTTTVEDIVVCAVLMVALWPTVLIIWAIQSIGWLNRRIWQRRLW
jgi:hypothetical protein